MRLHPWIWLCVGGKVEWGGEGTDDLGQASAEARFMEDSLIGVSARGSGEGERRGRPWVQIPATPPHCPKGSRELGQ